MKKIATQLWVYVLLVVQTAVAQTIKIQDPNFKKALIGQGIDLNGDGEIQAGEALKVTKLYVNKQQISSLSGIKSFTNLEEFGFYDNELKTADFQGLKRLRAIYGFNNSLEQLVVKGCVNLERISVAYNKIAEIDLTGLSMLKELELHHNRLIKIDVGKKPVLFNCELNDNQLATFSSEGSNAIKILRLDANSLSFLNLTHLKDLEVLNLYENRDLTALKISGLRKLKELTVDYCPLTNLKMSGTVSLKDFSWQLFTK